ncbi:hypothetical protein CerSpe_162680 [Prunus speciosa]
MHYAPSLEIVSDIGNYDWGGAALACLYRSMDFCSRGRSSSMGGYWRAWEVWACEYLKPFSLARPSGTLNTRPQALRWLDAKAKRDLHHPLVHFRVMMRHLTNDMVNWNPWGIDESEMPKEVKNTMPATRK